MKQILQGTVVSNKAQKTVVVEVVRLKKHPRYGKYITLSHRYQAHTDEPVPLGSAVRIVASRPYSKEKRWKILEVVHGVSLDNLS